ncbi:MAG: DUF1080 domain-containing protein [Alistipes indistinctus]
MVNHDLTCMVRQLQPTETGIPIQLYFFSNIKELGRLRRVQADVFDHVMSVIREFDLYIYQGFSGQDLQQSISGTWVSQPPHAPSRSSALSSAQATVTPADSSGTSPPRYPDLRRRKRNLPPRPIHLPHGLKTGIKSYLWIVLTQNPKHMNRLFPPVTLLAFCLCTGATAQTAAKTSATPSPKHSSGRGHSRPGDVLIPAPSDAQVLFDGKDLAQWCRKDGSPAAWTVENGDMVVKAKSGNIQTKRNFGDCQLHIEWCTPENVSDTGQLRSNSGVFLQSLYEVQILDSYLNDTYWNGQAGSITSNTRAGQRNQSAGPVERLRHYLYRPRFNADGSLLSAARITVLQNGVLVRTTPRSKARLSSNIPPTPHRRCSIMLQDHGNAVRFRNIWIRELSAPDRDIKRSANAYNPDHHTRQAPM